MKHPSFYAGFVRGDDVLHKLFTELAYKYKDRVGGYTRLLRTIIRVGDAALMAYIELRYLPYLHLNQLAFVIM
nr:50S ribosomal protein L17-like [Ipomoea batatas]